MKFYLVRRVIGLSTVFIALLTGISHAQTNLSQYVEGTRTELTVEQANALTLAVRNIKQNLQDTLIKVDAVSLSESKRILLEGLKQSVLKSSTNTSETLSRYILNRTLKVVEIMDSDTNQSLDQEVALLLRAIKLVVRYTALDLETLTNPHLALPYAQLGVDYAELLMAINESTLNANRQLEIGLFVLKIFRKDLLSDAQHDQYASPIVRLSSLLDHPTLANTDAEAVKTYQSVRLAYREAIARLKSTPLKVSFLSGLSAVAIGPDHACAIIQGAVFCWGANDWGQLGSGNETASATPLQILGIANATGIAVGDKHSCAVSQGQVYCWGLNTVQSGITMIQHTKNTRPFAVVGIAGVSAIAAAGNHTCVIAQAQAYCWGENIGGVFPDASQHRFFSLGTSETPVVFPNVKNVNSIAVSQDHLCLLSGNEILCAGNAENGGMGRSVQGDQRIDKKGLKPEVIGQTEMVMAAGLQTCASSRGKIYCWGGGIAIPEVVGLSSSSLQSPLAMGYHCTKLNGMALCWDENHYRSTVANSVWKMSGRDVDSIQNIQSLDLGVGMVSAIVANEFGSCTVINLASGNQQLYCAAPNQEMKRMPMFDRLEIQQTSTVSSEWTIDPSKMSKHELEDYKIFVWMRNNTHGSHGDRLTYEEYLTSHRPVDFERKAILNMIKDEQSETEVYKHPVGCAAKRVAIGLLTQGLLGNKRCP